jgi:hypothetical protein
LKVTRPLRHSAVALALLSLLGPALAQTVLPEVQVTTSAIPDFEFDSARNGVNCPTCNAGDGNSRLAFSDRDGRLWLGKVDFNTGAFVPTTGRGRQIDSFTAPVTCFGNGPEWMSSAAGSQIVYTRFVNGSGLPGNGTVNCTASSPQIALASLGSSGWRTQVLPNSLNRITPDGTKDATDTDPRVNYVQGDKEALFWRKRSALSTEVEMPINDLTGGNSRRWVPGTRKIIFQGHLATDPRLLDQVWLYDTDTKKREQLTFDSVTKAGGFMWRAPEYGNEYVFFTMANFRQELWVYRKLRAPSGNMVWTVTKKIRAPKSAGLPYFWSPEVFTHNGRSYIFTQVSPSNKFFDKSIPTHLAITSIDPLKSDLRLLTNDTTKPRVRLDPEFFITAKGPFIYYNRLVPANSTYPDGINDGVWRVDTRLGPPKR